MAKRNGKQKPTAEALAGSRHEAGRLLLDMDEDIEEVRNFLEALHMMALDIESTPSEEATPAFRTIAQCAIDRCEALREKGWQAKDLLRNKAA